MRKDDPGSAKRQVPSSGENPGSPVAPMPDYGLLAVRYLQDQHEGRHLRALASFIAEYHRNAPDLGRRKARKVDLMAAANAAARLRQTLSKLDVRTKMEALGPQPDHRPASGGPPNATGHRFPASAENLGELQRLLSLLETGLQSLTTAVVTTPKGGQPVRHDALVLGVESLAALWSKHGHPPPRESYNNRGFGRFAVEMFAADPVGFSEVTVKGAVADFVRSQKVPRRRV